MTHTIARTGLSPEEWQRKFLDAIHDAKSVVEVNEWQDMNLPTLDLLSQTHPDKYKFIQEQLSTARGNLLHAP